MSTQHGGDQRREVRVGAVEEVDALRRAAAGDHVDARREARRRDQLAAQPVDERLRLGEAVVVPAGDDHLA